MAKESLKNFLKLEPFNGGLLSEGIFKYQEALIEEYIRRGKLKPMPLDLSSKEDQNFLRKLIGDFGEELAEASEVYHIRIAETFSSSVYTEDKAQNELRKLCHLFTEELVDAMHFLTEISIYLNIGPEDISSLLNTIIQEKNLPMQTGDFMTTGLWYSRYLNTETQEELRLLRGNAFKLPSGNQYQLAGSILNLPLIEYSKGYFWEVTQSLFLARNLLKLKDTRDVEVESNINAIQIKVVDTWVRFLQLVDMLGITSPEHLYYHYEQKTLLNQHRLLTKT